MENAKNIKGPRKEMEGRETRDGQKKEEVERTVQRKKQNGEGLRQKKKSLRERESEEDRENEGKQQWGVSLHAALRKNH